MIFNPVVAGGKPVETVTGQIYVWSTGATVKVVFVDADGSLQERTAAGQFEVPKNSILVSAGDYVSTSGSVEKISDEAYFVSGDFAVYYE